MYTACTLSLAALEYLAHIDPDDAPNDLIAMEIELPAATVFAELAQHELPANWRAPMAPRMCQRMGGDWLASHETLALRVPSVRVPEERNVLHNAAHADMGVVRVLSVRPFGFDVRLLRGAKLRVPLL